MPKNNGSITLTKDSLVQLKSAYGSAVKADLSKFKFQGEFLDVSYAKYLIEYAESIFNNG